MHNRKAWHAFPLLRRRENRGSKPGPAGSWGTMDQLHTRRSALCGAAGLQPRRALRSGSHGYLTAEEVNREGQSLCGVVPQRCRSQHARPSSSLQITVPFPLCLGEVGSVWYPGEAPRPAVSTRPSPGPVMCYVTWPRRIEAAHGSKADGQMALRQGGGPELAAWATWTPLAPKRLSHPGHTRSCPSSW